MKFIRVQITDTLHTRLKALTTHHGEFSHLIRRAIKDYVTLMETEAKNVERNTTLREGTRMETSKSS